MKIVNRTTFLASPEGTLFSKYDPGIFGDLCIKGRSINSIDFTYQPLNDCISGEIAHVAYELNDGQSFSIDLNCEYRDGLFDQFQLFAVWERKDVESLISRLQESLIHSDEYDKI